ncbi:MAG: phage portal protein [Alphaproteobacteria bacterium]|nr:phage portal protein [Alphaproteobacteria bacterium]
MALLDLFRRRAERRDNIQDPTVPVSASSFLQFFGLTGANLQPVTLESAMTVPPVFAAVTFLSGTLAALPLHVYRKKSEAAPERLEGGLDSLVGDAPNDEWTSFRLRQYFWSQVFTHGRGLAYIEWGGNGQVAGLWPMDVLRTRVERNGFRNVYVYDGRQRFDAADVIDIPFLLRHDQISVFGPIMQGAKTIQRALAMMDYAAGFFAGGGVPPLSVSGPLPTGADAMRRAGDDIQRAIKHAQTSNTPIVQLPAGFELKQIGFDPQKGQMNDAWLAIIQDFARIWGLPPVVLQDLSKGTFTNTEQQDLHLVKHVIRRWAVAFEQEANLKLFGRKGGGRFVEHNLDGLLRGDLVSRMTALAQGVQNGLVTPNEGRELDNRGAMAGGDRLYIQGATVPLDNAGSSNGKTQSGSPA